MIYLKTILYLSIFLLIVNSTIFVTYYNISYYNLALIIVPIIGIIFCYMFFKILGVQRFNPRLFKLNLKPNLALFIAFICNILVLRKFDLNKFINGNVEDIRNGFNQFDVSLMDQLLPVLLVYPALYALVIFGGSKDKLDWKFFAVVFGLVFFGLSTGGRAFIFIFLLLYLFITKPNLFTFKNFSFLCCVIFIFSFITVGRINKDLEFDTVTYIEATAPVEFNKYLKDENINVNLRNVVVQTAFYFGHSIPAFCNKVENLQIELLPRSIFGLQPFVERQLIRIGILQHDQNQRYLEMLSLAKRSGFFEESWSTTFLDVYYQEGVIFSILFFLLVSVILYNTEKNYQRTKSVKYLVLTGFNCVFIITFFLTPAFMDTTWFFTYISFLFCNDKNLLA